MQRSSALLRVSLAALTATVLIGPGIAAAATTGQTGGLDGTVFLDLDGDGERGPDEPGRGGVGVTVRTAATILDATTTAADGSWSLTALPAGSYTVGVEVPIDHVVTGGSDGPVAGESVWTTTVTAGETRTSTLGLGSPVAAGPDVTATVTGTPDTDGATWLASVHNMGVAAAEGPIDARFVLGDGHQATGVAGSGWTCEQSAAIVLCTTEDGLDAGASLPELTLTSAFTGDVGSRVAVTATARLEGVFDAAPLNDEDEATATIGATAVTADVDGDGANDLSETGAPVATLLLGVLAALLGGAALLRSTRST